MNCRCYNCKYAESTANVYSIYCKLHKDIVDRTDYCDKYLEDYGQQIQ